MSGPGDRRDAGGNGVRDVEDSRAGLDSDLRDSFAVLRRQEQAAAPGFAAMSEAAAKSQPNGVGSRRLRPLLVAAAGAAVACAALVVGSSVWLRTHAPHARPSLQAESSITGWRPVTDFLLRTPGQEVLAGPPPFGSSSIGMALGAGRAAADRHDTQRRP
ncbi:MAG: hypothetical protein JOZ15_11490 [Acidobacteria bacterium]|nr:hypothetical protein [Acidobacteriota bacterium]